MGSLPEFDVSTLPVKVAGSKDWTGAATTPVKNQGQCGSCWAFSAVEQIESDLMLQHGTKIELAPQELVDCTSRGSGSRRNGCQGGFPSAGYQVIQALGGIEKESDYPYTATNGVCRFSRSKAAVTVTSYNSVGQGSETAMKQYVGSSGPLSVCVDASSWSSYRGGVMTSCGRSVDHCVQLVGYGESGHVRLQIGSNLCDINSSPTKVSATTVGPSPSPSPSPTPTPSPSPGQCHAISAVVTDDWCEANCAAGFCPSDLCQCDSQVVV